MKLKVNVRTIPAREKSKANCPVVGAVKITTLSATFAFCFYGRRLFISALILRVRDYAVISYG